MSSPGVFDFSRYLRDERVHVDRALRRALDRLQPELPEGVAGAVGQGVLAEGKRLRPICCVTAFRACVGDPFGESAGTAIHDLAVSLELIHAYSLMHDDLPCMDNAPLRRGQPTPHTIWGEAETLVGGAALIPAAGLHLRRAAAAMGLNDEVSREAVRVLARAAGAGGMVGGQGLDLLGEGRALARSELDGLHRRKTGALLTASFVLGGLAAGAPPYHLEVLTRYGEELGLAFQIADDILDATSDSVTLGKAPSDADLGKSTYVGLLGVDEARMEADRRVRDAVTALEQAGIASPALAALARYVVERDR